MAEPTTLLQVISRCNEPPLGDKFQLAYLWATLSLLHSSQCLHKAFGGDSILPFEGSGKKGTWYLSILKQHITSFEYSRKTKMESIDYRPTGKNPLDYCYHPDVINGFTKAMELYSLGVILLELASWESLSEKIVETEQKKKKKLESLEEIKSLFLESTETSLAAVMESIYANVVKACLNCSLPEDDEEYACAMATCTISKLALCRA